MFENNFLNNIINSFKSFKNTHLQHQNVNGANIALGSAKASISTMDLWMEG